MILIPRDGQLGCARVIRHAALLAGVPEVGVCVPAQVRRLSEPDRTVVEGIAQPRVQGQVLRDLGTGM